MIQSFLAQLALGVDLVPVLERVMMVGIDPDGRVILMHSLFSILGQHLLNPAISLCLPGRAARRRPPPGGGDPHRGLRGTAFRLRCVVSQTWHLPLGYLPARLEDKAM